MRSDVELSLEGQVVKAEKLGLLLAAHLQRRTSGCHFKTSYAMNEFLKT